MFELQTYLAKPQSLIDIEFGSDLVKVYKYQREKLYVHISDTANLRKLSEYKGMESLGNNEMKFLVMLDHNNQVIISVNLPEWEFIKALLNELKRILSCMVNHGAFNGLSEGEYEPKIILRRIERCESLFNEGH